MQSYYSNPHQLQAAAVAAAAASGAQRLPFQPPFPGLHDTPGGRSALLRGLHGTPRSSPSLCGPTPLHPPGSTEEINESEMESDIISENDDDDIDSEKLDLSHRDMLAKLKRQVEEEREEVDPTESKNPKDAQLNTRLISSSHKRQRESVESNEHYEKADVGSDDLEDEVTMQTEIKVQRPLGLLAQHGLTMKSSSMAKTHSSQSLQFANEHDPELDRHDWEQKERKSVQENENELDRERRDLIERDKESLTGLDFSSHMSLMDRRFMPSPPPLASPTGLDPNKGPSTPSGHHWTFEEQFKQLYEMSPEPKRKEFLDDLFTFMQKRGTPVNRIPIMAKQTLDLYELFRLVVSKGGLVEVINKKLWREITKGLNLPSSITSAAFTLRTQYMKYLYPYECDKLKLSTLAELQSAIDGNRREGRRPGYGYDFSPIPTMLSTPPTPHMNGPGLHPLANTRPPTGLSPKDDERSMLQMSHNHVRSLAAEHDARAMEVATRAMEDLVNKRMEEVSRAAIASNVMTTAGSISAASMNSANKFDEMPPCKRPAMFDDERFLAHMGMHSTHIKLNSRSNGRLEYDSSMVVSMEINGMMYQGVLFAQHPRRI